MLSVPAPPLPSTPSPPSMASYHHNKLITSVATATILGNRYVFGRWEHCGSATTTGR
ncbi:hypothetical protein MTR_3g101390 [Medicago truncatula]|uniref:Uncharacterized protein n=1 Tax=Medicago truncatula TaxID=3880 RepID=G7J6A7_MEDTR|nr:hypothetical protein MTR_3g101390 [Medicago truncatula]